MKYSILHNGTTIDLPKYTFDIDDKIASLTAEINRGGGLRKVSKKMYDFCVGLLGDEIVTETIGEFDDCDPNELQIFVKEIFSAYAEPVMSYEQDKLNDLYDIEKLKDVIEVAEKASTLKV